MEDGSASGGELVLTPDAFIASVFFQARNASVFTPWTHNALRPTQPLKQLTASFVSRVEIINIKESHGRTS
ncbi:MAG: hypothetical protein WBV36_10190 [Terriglobales bacterium]